MSKTDIAFGDRIKDNDPRMSHRGALTVKEIQWPKAVCENRFGRRFHIALNRIYTDGKPRRSGFSRTEVAA